MPSSFNDERDERDYDDAPAHNPYSARPRHSAPAREFRAPEFRPQLANKPKTHFEICDKITIKIDYDFAVALGQFLLQADVIDKRFKSLGHHLCNLEQDA